MNEGVYPESYPVRVRFATGLPLEECSEERSLPEDLANRERTWIKYLESLKSARLKQPIIVLIGGATCTGKSTLASDIAFRLGIRQVVSTDSIREVLKALLPASPILALPTYRSYETRGERFDKAELASSLEQQSLEVWRRVIPVIERCVWGGEGIVLEGANLLPSVVMKDAPSWLKEVVYSVVKIEDALYCPNRSETKRPFN